VGWWLERPWRFRPKVGIVALVLFLALVAIVSSLALTHATAQDAGLYFVQSTLWVQRFRVVPGLADLHPCLGYNQTYFFWVGAFSGGPFSDRPWVVANGILFLAAAGPGIVRTQVQQNLLPAGRAGPPQRRTLAFAEFFCGRESRVVGLLLGWNGMQSGRNGTFSSKTELAAISQITLPSPRCTIDLAIGYSSLDPAEMAPSPGSMHRKGGVVKWFCTG
jgi:hypothetical protein